MTAPQPRIRPARPADVPAVVAMAHELAEFERAPELCHLTADQLEAALFADRPALFGHVGVDAAADDQPIAYALWFLNFSTWEGVHGIYLEDLYVRPAARSTGLGTALLATLAALCVERGYARLEWWVLHWNPAREFYRAIGATPMDEWVPYRLDGDSLRALGACPPTHACLVESTSKPRPARVARRGMAFGGPADERIARVGR